MNVLAIETATSACAGALHSAHGEWSFVADDDRHHTESLTPGLRDLLSQAGLGPKSIDVVVVDRGPGLYTGLRVGIASAIGFALGASAGLVGVTSLELLALGAHRQGVRGTFVSAVDGRRGELFVQTFELDDAVVARDEPLVATPNALVECWTTREGHVTFSGDGAKRYDVVLRDVPDALFFDQVVPPTHEALRLGATRPPESTVAPLYLRDADAVANFSTRERP